MEELHRKVCLIATVRQTQHRLQLLLSCSDFVAALDLIAGAEHVLQTELKGVTSLKNTAAQLQEMGKVVQRMMRSEFVSLCVGKDRMLRDTRGVLGGLGSSVGDEVIATATASRCMPECSTDTQV